MLRKVQIHNESIESAGAKKDYKEAISEYILNAFEADATTVTIDSDLFTLSNQSGVDEIRIADNGYGIVFDTLDATFESLF